MTPISIVAAVCENGCIGTNNSLPFNLGGELKYFKKITEGKVVVYGKETYLSLGRKPLANRFNIVVSRTLPENEEGIFVVRSLEEAINKASILNRKRDSEIMIIGGASIYEQCIGFADYLYLTEAKLIVHGDTYFPKYNKLDWDTVSEEIRYKNQVGGNADYIIKKLIRR